MNRAERRKVRYISIFSGIEAATVAWEPLGWEPVAFCEIDAFTSAVLAHRFPNVPNLGDITKVDWRNYRGEIDIIVGGSPCQSFSVAGKREGLAGESGLMLEYIRAVQEILPRYFVWENVPGALSCEKGAAFGQLLSEMDALGYGLAWRVLDAQFFNVAQRRERVFLVGCLGDPERAAEILFESDCLRWDHPSSREKRKAITACSERGSGSGSGECMTPWDAQNNRIYSEYGCGPCLQASASEGINIQQCVAYTLKIRSGCDGGGKGALVQEDMSATLSTSNEQTIFKPICMYAGCHHCAGFKFHQGSGAGSIGYEEENSPTITADWHVPAVMHADEEVRGCASRAISTNQRGEIRYDGVDGDTVGALPASRSGKQIQEVVCMADDNTKCAIDRNVSGTMKVRNSAPIVLSDYIVRRLTPIECERLQGFPDGWTDIAWKGKKAPDGKRYKALGNSMAVPVMRWIGERIDAVYSGTKVVQE